MLKAFLMCEHHTTKSLQDLQIRHSLRNLTDEAKGVRANIIDAAFAEAVDLLDEYNSKHRFRYFRDGQIDGPLPDALIAGIKPTMSNLHKHAIDKSIHEQRAYFRNTPSS